MVGPIRERIERAAQYEYITIEELSLLTHISTRTIWRRIQAGKLRLLKNGGCTRVHRASAMRYFQGQTSHN